MERVRAIFEYASELQPEEREKFLKQVCSEDPNLLAEVRMKFDQAHADTVELPPVQQPTFQEAHKFIFAPGDLIASRYLVIRAIAKGGMGEVYEVDDYELRSRVALKTISLKSAARPNAFEMFRREILLARQVTHPNVCRIYDLGHHNHPEHGDLLFLTMELLNGETLAHRVRNRGPFKKEEALPLLQQMIQALSAAHRLNIAHRDFKSGNVILCVPGAPGSGPVSASSGVATPDSHSDTRPTPASGSASGAPSPASSFTAGSSAGSAAGSSSGAKAAETKAPSPSGSSGSSSQRGVTVKVTDFGLARSVDGLETTVHGEVWGTPDYMAPEQFHGQSSIASDIYSLGVVIYEMFTATLPHRSSSGPSTPAGKPSTAMESIPAEWRPVVKKCMAYEPTERYASADEVWEALNGKEPSLPKHRSYARPAAAVLVVLVLLSTLGWFGSSWISRFFNLLPDQKHIAVLQFQSVGHDASEAAFSAGVGETLTSKLSQLGNSQPVYWVVPYSDSRRYTTIDDARRNLGVTLVITGTVQRSGSDVRVTTNLVDAKNHRQLASRVMTASVGDLNVLQDQLWESVADMVQVPLDDAKKKKVNEASTQSARAYDYYEQGVGYLQRKDIASLDKAVDAFEKSAAADSNFALAFAGLGNAYAQKYYVTKNPVWVADAKTYADRAAALGPDYAAVRETLGNLYENTGKLEDSLREYERASELNPMAVTPLLRIANIYYLQGKYPQSEETYKKAISRMPSYWAGHAGLGTLYFGIGRFREAAAEFQKVVELAPDNPLGYEDLGASYTQMGSYDEAIAVFKKGLTINESSDMWSDLGAAYMFAGKNAEAAEAMKKAVDLNPHNHTLWRNLADSYKQVPLLANRAPETYAKALEAAQQQLSANSHDKDALSGIALYQAHLGNKVEAQKYIAKALNEAPHDSDVLFTAALVYELMGERKQALSSLQDSLKAGFSIEDAKREPELQALRSDPRYESMVRGVHPREQ